MSENNHQSFLYNKLKRQFDELNNIYDLREEKLNRLRKARVVETSAGVQFSLDKEIENIEAEQSSTLQKTCGVAAMPWA